MSLQQLYELQLRLKRNKVNVKRKKAEIVGLCNSFDEEILNFQISLYNSSSQLWEFLNRTPKNIRVLQPLTKATKTKNKAVTDDLIKTRDSLQKYLENHITDGKLPKVAFMLILSLFNFCWSEESADAFVEKMLKLPKEQQNIVCSCLIPNPLLRVFFVSALKEVFNNFEYFSVEELTKITIESLRKYAPLMPRFMSKIIDESKELFCSLLIPFLEFFSIFGIAHYEITLFCPNKKEELIESLTKFFQSDAADALFNEIVTFFPIYVAPHEKDIVEIYPKFVPSTLITPDFYNIDEPTFVPLSTTTFPPSMFGSNWKGFTQTVRQLLLDCELICLESDEQKPYNALANLVSLTSFYGDPVLEKELDEIGEYLNAHPDLTIEAICRKINAELNAQENSQDQNPLLSISEYSKQSSFIKKNIEKINTTPSNAASFMNFIFVQKEIEKYNSDIEGKSFVDSFIFLKEKLDCKNFQQMRNLFSILVSKVKYLDKHNYDKENEEMHKYIAENKEKLLSMHKQDFLEIYKKDPSLLTLFFTEFELAFKTRIPIARMEHIHNSYTILIGLLKEQGIGDIGADQIVPLAMIATVLSNPIGLAETKAIFSDILQPLITVASPINSAEEYSLIQFLSTLQFLVDQKPN